VENLAEDADDVFFSRIPHTENHVLHPLLVCYPNETTMVMNCDAEDLERELFLRPRCQT